ncbi:dTDP-4-dehydrorhamnose 3,5-epimerase family protein [Flagellimonas lutimaris]|uniref:dTDP-4-dehydrorhamnose 3,5-epimerase family protein n=1 Tax=Flagellimonas lutimaris TaxID=475082 RepID=UPI0039C00CD4|tara:strand:- start:11536 stop:12075 length:540 start_codon:yes stop_codon:yes gene_type:complete
MKFVESGLPGCYTIITNDFKDDRGVFFKTFHIGYFKEFGLEVDWKEEYFSISNKNVIRGMHFQNPPHDHVKVVTCLSGSVTDVILDLRRNSPMYRSFVKISLTADSDCKMVYIPRGCAHGFLSLENDTLLHYKVSSVYSPKHDKGVKWNSFGFNWGVENPVISERDSLHPPLNEFKSKF